MRVQRCEALFLAAVMLAGCADKVNGARPPAVKKTEPMVIRQVGTYQPLPLPPQVYVKSSAPRVQLWDALTAPQKKLATHLANAATAGRDILFFQRHRHALRIRAMLEQALSADNIEDTRTILGREGFDELLVYTAKFMELAGPYSSGSNRKYVLKKVKPEQLELLAQVYADEASEAARKEIVLLLTDPNYEVIERPEDKAGTDLLFAGGNFYDRGISGEEVAAALSKGLASAVNCRIVRDAQKGLRCQVQALSTPDLPMPVRKSLKKIVRELRLAQAYALTPHQKRQFELMVSYLETGNEELFREYNREWVRDRTDSVVDFMIGYVEVYEDYLGTIASWESYLQIVDPATTQQSLALARRAQEFEAQMPYGKYRRDFPKDYSPPASMVYYLQEISSMRTAGYNLPNYEDIRNLTGAKNIIRLDLPGEEHDPESQAVQREWITEFAPAARVEAIATDSQKAFRVLVLLHEIIGHGSGNYEKSEYPDGKDPVQVLGQLGGALEEQRADLTALVFAADPKLIEVGIYRDQAEAVRIQKAMYDLYAADFLRRFSRARAVAEAHMRGHWLFANIALERGAIREVARNGGAKTPENMVHEVADYDKFKQVANELLAELQRIKAVRDEVALKRLFDAKAPLDVNETAWAKAVIARGERLRTNQGSVEQPWKITGGKIELLGSALTLEGIATAWKRLAE